MDRNDRLEEEARVNGSGRVRHILLFCLKFVCFAPVVLVVWWTLVPSYSYVIGEVCGMILKYVFGQPIQWLEVNSKGILDTQTVLSFGTADGVRPIEVAFIVNNVPSYIALVLATPALRLKRRLRVMAIGLGLLFVGHIAFLVGTFLFMRRIAESPEIPQAFGFFLLTLPFVLWIVLAYWDRLSTYFAEDDLEPR